MKSKHIRSINEALEIIATARRLAILCDGVTKREIDDFIYKAGTRQIEKLDNMGEADLLMFLLKKAALSPEDIQERTIS